MCNWVLKLSGLTLLFVLFAASAAADEPVFRSMVVGSMPGQMIAGMASAGAPWVVSKGRARLDENGRLRVEVDGLVLSGPGVPPSLEGTTGPVTHVRASLVCGGSGGMVVATTDAVPLNSAGDAKIDEMIMMPTTRCFGPSVLVRIGGTTSSPPPLMGPWIAASGFSAEGAGRNRKDE